MFKKNPNVAEIIGQTTLPSGATTDVDAAKAVGKPAPLTANEIGHVGGGRMAYNDQYTPS